VRNNRSKVRYALRKLKAYAKREYQRVAIYVDQKRYGIPKGKQRYSIVCICQIYNELQKGNLPRFVKFVEPLVDRLVAWDDASTDGSYEYLLQHTSHVLRSNRRDYKNLMAINQTLLTYALNNLNPDFILYLDADEVFTENITYRLQELCDYCVRNYIDALSFHELNLWRSKSWRRIDDLYDEGWKTALWRIRPGMTYGKLRRGLHLRPYPATVRRIRHVKDVQVIHYGFSSERLIADKYLTYKALGQRGWSLDRLLDEQTLALKKVPKELFPNGLYEDDDMPSALAFKDALTYVERYRDAVSLADLPT
jgi:hypothetical protein